MELHTLIQTKEKSKKRVGRGIGSGKGKTAGRGTKGQKARGKTALGFIGGTLPLYKKLPFRRGLGNPKRSVKMLPISLSKLNLFKTGETVNLQSLVDRGVIKGKDVKRKNIKITGDGDINVALTIMVPTTARAVEKIEKAGGKVIRE